MNLRFFASDSVPLRNGFFSLAETLNIHFYAAAIIWCSTIQALPVTPARPILDIPFGSYLAQCDLSRTHMSGGDLSSHCSQNPGGFFEGRYGFSRLISMHDAGSCWSEGADITINSAGQFECDRTVSREPVNAADFLYSRHAPMGSYTKSCRGILRAEEEGRSFLYATCISGNGVYPQRRDITNCQGMDIHNDNGRLNCRPASENTENVMVSGSYLQQCDLGLTHYDPLRDQLRTLCGHAVLSYDSVTTCVDAGMDIKFLNNELRCVSDTETTAQFHTSGSLLPAGNYLLTCKGLNYYPCLRHNGVQGVLVGTCTGKLNYSKNQKFSSLLTNGAGQCRFSGAGFVSNINGELRCDPDIDFSMNTGAGERPDFECSEE